MRAALLLLVGMYGACEVEFTVMRDDDVVTVDGSQEHTSVQDTDSSASELLSSQTGLVGSESDEPQDLRKLMREFRNDNFDTSVNAALAHAFQRSGEQKHAALIRRFTEATASRPPWRDDLAKLRAQASSSRPCQLPAAPAGRIPRPRSEFPIFDRPPLTSKRHAVPFESYAVCRGDDPVCMVTNVCISPANGDTPEPHALAFTDDEHLWLRLLRVNADGLLVHFSRAFALATETVAGSARTPTRWVDGCTLWIDHLAGSSFGHTLEWAPQIAKVRDEVARGAFAGCDAIDWGFVHRNGTRRAMLMADSDDLLRAALGSQLPPLFSAGNQSACFDRVLLPSVGASTFQDWDTRSLFRSAVLEVTP